MKIKNCEVHGIEYNYICPECVKSFLKNTPFSNLEEIRNYQKENAKKVYLIDKITKYNLIGIINLKISENLAYSALLIYDIKGKNITDIKFKSYKPIFTEYFPSILFLNQTEIYLDLIKDIKIIPDCYIINASVQIHPYLYGAACDFGLQTETPVVGYTKKLLFGELRKINENLNIPEIYYREKLIGYAIPKPNSKKFLYVSVGNNISLITTLKLFNIMDFEIFSVLSGRLNNFIQNELKKIIKT